MSKLPKECSPMPKRKITYTLLSPPSRDKIALEYCLVNVVQIHLRQHCPRKLFAQCWPRVQIYFRRKTAFSNVWWFLVYSGTLSPNNLDSFCSTFTQKFMYSLWDNNEQEQTLTGTIQPNRKRLLSNPSNTRIQGS